MEEDDVTSAEMMDPDADSAGDASSADEAHGELDAMEIEL